MRHADSAVAVRDELLWLGGHEDPYPVLGKQGAGRGCSVLSHRGGAHVGDKAMMLGSGLKNLLNKSILFHSISINSTGLMLTWPTTFHDVN